MMRRSLMFAMMTGYAWVGATMAIAAQPLRIDVPARTMPVDFATEIAPLLQANCVACHNQRKAEGGLSLESLASIVQGGEQGPAIVPGKGDESLLLAAASHRQDTIMPPPDNIVGAKPLTPSQLGLLKLWIDQGASGKDISTREIHWQSPPGSYQPAFAAAVTPDGQFAVCSRGRQICVYQLPTGKVSAMLVDPALARLSPSADSQFATAHHDIVRSLAFDPAGDLLASGGFREVKLWRRPRVSRSAEWTHEAAVRSLAVSTDGKYVATGDERGHIRIWETSSSKTLQLFAAHDRPITGIAFSTTEERLFSCSLDKSIKGWRLDGTSLGNALVLPEPIDAIIAIDETRQLVTGDQRGMALVWDVASLTKLEGDAPKPLAEIKAHGGAITSLAADADKPTEFLSGSADGFVRRWDAKSGSKLAEYKNDAPVVAVAVNGKARRTVAASAGTIKLWDDNSKLIATIGGNPRGVSKLAKIDSDITFTKAVISRSENDLKSYEGLIRIAGVTKDAVKMAEDEAKKAEKTRDEKKEALEKLKADGEKADKTKLDAAEKALVTAETAVTVAGTVIERAKAVADRTDKKLTDAQAALAAQKENLKQQEAARAEAAEAVKNATAKVSSLAFSHDARSLVIGCDDGAVHVFDAESGTWSQSLEGHRGAVQALAFSADEKLFTGSADHRALVWNVPSQWRLERVIGGLDRPEILVDRVLSINFNRDGKRLATGGGIPSRSGEIKIFDVGDGRLVREIAGAHSETVFAVRFSPDGKQLASAAGDRLIKVFDAESGKETHRFAGHTGHVLGLSWKADGKTLASSGADNVIKLWDLESSQFVRTMKGGSYGSRTYKGSVTGVSFIGDSEEIVAVSGDGTVRLQRASSDQEIMTFAGSKGYQFGMAATPDGKSVIAGGSDGTLRVWTGHQPQPKLSLSP